VARPGITVSFQDGATLRSARVDLFTERDLPRSYLNGSDLAFSNPGSAVQSGSTRAARLIWSVAGYVNKATALDLMDLFAAWDVKRATGAVSVVRITDETFLRVGAPPITSMGIFTTPVKVTRTHEDSYLVSYGVTEV
jgi:hypothetical protein